MEWGPTDPPQLVASVDADRIPGQSGMRRCVMYVVDRGNRLQVLTIKRRHARPGQAVSPSTCSRVYTPAGLHTTYTHLPS